MDHLLAAQNLIFYIPLAVGLLLVFGAAFAGQDADQDAEQDVEQDADSSPLGGALSVLGVGRVPLTLVLMMASLLFGGIGMMSNTVLAAFGLSPGIYGVISVGVASLGMLTLTGASARLLSRLMPASETYRVSRHDFAGCSGILILPADGSSGYAQVKDPEGNVHNIKCVTARGELAKGTEILVIKYDEKSKTYVVDASQTATESPH